MKIEIDLNDIIGDEWGAETLKDSVKRQILEGVTRQIRQGISDEVGKVLNEELSKAVKEQIPGIVNDLINAEYTPVDRYGDSKPSTTFRKELLRVLQEEMVYKKAQYASDKNAFTKAIDAVIESQMKEFQSGYNKIVTDQFTKDAFDYAVNKLRERMGLK